MTGLAPQYVMGQVVNRDGAPLAGVRIVMRDPWGNQSETMSKGGSNDYGQFDFPIWADGPQDLVLTVVDESGNPLKRADLDPAQERCRRGCAVPSCDVARRLALKFDGQARCAPAVCGRKDHAKHARYRHARQ